MSGPDARIFSLAHLTALSCSPPELVELAADAGFSSCGLRLGAARRGEEPFPMTGRSPMRKATLDAMRVREVGVLDVEVVCLYPETRAEDFLPLMEASAELGASFLIVNSEDPDEARIADTFAALCALARPFALRPALEFMRYRELKSLAQTMRVLARAGSPSAALIIDTLHFFRAETAIDELRQLPPQQIAFVQLSDAPASAPPLRDLPDEARFDRLLPGQGGLPLADLMAALPKACAISVEVPTRSGLSPSDHARRAWEAGHPML